MADYTQPQFCLPFTCVGTVTITFTDTSTQACTVATATRYNDRTGVVGTDALTYVAAAMDTDDGGGDWAASEVSGDYLGKSILTRSNISDGKTVSKIAFSAGLTGRMFGYSSNAPTATATANVVTGTWIRQYLWIPQPASLILMANNEKTDVETVVATSSPDGTTTRDSFGSVDKRTIEILTVPGACVWRDRTDDADYAAVIGATTGDQNAALSEFRALWAAGLPASTYCRFFPDVNTLATFHKLEPGEGARWMGDLNEALEMESKAPLRYSVRLDAFEVA